MIRENIPSNVVSITKPVNKIKPEKPAKTSSTLNTPTVYELEKELALIPDTTKGLGKKLAKSIKNKIVKIKHF